MGRKSSFRGGISGSCAYADFCTGGCATLVGKSEYAEKSTCIKQVLLVVAGEGFEPTTSGL